ncbi:MAG: sugar phosphate isomerase/epimerase family protein [Chitinophagaceae bacterium]
MLTRRHLLTLSGAAGIAALLPDIVSAAIAKPIGPFRFCLNTSTISGQKPGLLKMIEIAATAGYDGMELWVRDIEAYLQQGNTIASLNQLLRANNLRVENAISFTEWMVDDDARRSAGIATLEKEMKMMAELGCRRIAAPPAGVSKDQPIDFKKAGDRYRETIVLGKKYGVMPLLEFWGASGTVYNFSQALAIAAAANDPDARILPDVYHMFRGGSGFDCLNLVNGRVIDIIHMNDYPADKAAGEQTDADRVYPGDGAAPLKQILHTLKTMGGTKTLSLELFNKTYWDQDPLLVAKTGLAKMKAVVNLV